MSLKKMLLVGQSQKRIKMLCNWRWPPTRMSVHVRTPNNFFFDRHFNVCVSMKYGKDAIEIRT
jgi:hypothetical protein